MKLFCLPYAGGASIIYNKWTKYIDKNIEVCPIELAGRGERYDEPFYNTINEAVEDIYKIVMRNINIESNEEYMFFGHSMGSILSYELSHKIKKEKINGPKHIFFSGHEAPDIKKDEKKICDLPDQELKKEILNMGGTEKEVFDNWQLTDYLLPIIRADFRMIENYKCEHEGEILDSNITVMNGKEDSLSLTDIVGWRKHTCGNCKIYMFEGDHFYINENIENICKIINDTYTKKINTF